MTNLVHVLKIIIPKKYWKSIIYFFKNEKTSYRNYFIKKNCKLWTTDNSNCKKKILIEGFLSSYGPNYLIRTSLLSKGINIKEEYQNIVLFNNPLFVERIQIKLYKSFGIEKFLSTCNYNISIINKFKILIEAKNIYKNILNINSLLILKYKGICFGDLLYDTLIKDYRKLYTIDNKTIREFIYIFKSLILINQYSRILDEVRPELYIATHSQYLDYGLMVRICLSKKVQVLETTDILLAKYSVTEYNNNRYPLFHDYLNGIISNRIKHEKFRALNQKSEIINRLNGNYEQSDVILAYNDKKIYKRNELKDKLNIDNNNPIVFIFSHVFSDAPQGLSSGMIYIDFYVWLLETIKIASKVKEINWIVKPHPAVKLYGELGIIEKIVLNNSSNNIFLSPSDFSPLSMKNIAKAIITAQGTVGLEYSCVGIPVILASKPFYGGFGFTIDCKSVEEYETVLKSIAQIEELNEKQKNLAIIIYNNFISMSEKDTSIIDSNVLFNVWNPETNNKDYVYKLLLSNLEDKNIKDNNLFVKAQSFIK